MKIFNDFSLQLFITLMQQTENEIEIFVSYTL